MRSDIMEVLKPTISSRGLMLAELSSRIQHSSFQEPLGFDLPAAVVTLTVPPEQTPPKARQGSPRELSFGLLSAVCKPELVDNVLADCDRLEKRCRLLPARLMVYALLRMCLSADLSYQKLMRHLGDAALLG